jgi:hypothetical protein
MLWPKMIHASLDHKSQGLFGKLTYPAFSSAFDPQIQVTSSALLGEVDLLHRQGLPSAGHRLRQRRAALGVESEPLFARSLHRNQSIAG